MDRNEILNNMIKIIKLQGETKTKVCHILEGRVER